MSLIGSIWSKLVVFRENGQNWVIWGQNGATGQNLGKLVKIFSLKVSKNYFSQVYGHKIGQKCD